ncbi:MAG: hypothetical protein NTU53_09565 [Planctomycetota bacterium]|nr:hypothetical protein [Planctomycetota bacterium]
MLLPLFISLAKFSSSHAGLDVVGGQVTIELSLGEDDLVVDIACPVLRKWKRIKPAVNFTAGSLPLIRRLWKLVSFR